MTRRQALQSLLTLAAAPLYGQESATAQPDSFKVYSDRPRLLLRPARLKLLRRERERRAMRWDQFETLALGKAEFLEPGFAAALRYQLSDNAEAGREACAWAAGAGGTDIRQVALVADWCEPVLTENERARINDKLKRAAAAPPAATLSGARDQVFAAIAISEAQPDVAEKALSGFFDHYWKGRFLPGLRAAKLRVSNADAYPLLEILHAVRDNLNFDLRDTFPQWFKQYPLTHLMAHYPAPWPASANEFRLPADPTILKKEPNLHNAMLSRSAELAMVAFDANSAETQVIQGWLLNDRFLMRGTAGIPYELLWANPYQPGLSYYHVPLALHDEIGGQLFVRSSWEDTASWVGFFEAKLQLFRDGGVTEIDPRLSREPLDVEEATIFFARDTQKFHVPPKSAEKDLDDVFIVGLEPRRPYHVEVDDEEMREETADAGGIIFLPAVRGGIGVRMSPVHIT